MKTKFTKPERHRIYKRAYELHLIDVKVCKIHKQKLDGMCHELVFAILDLGYSTPRYSKLGELLPEFHGIKPKGKSYSFYWWKVDWHNRTRIKKYKLLIEQTRP